MKFYIIFLIFILFFYIIAHAVRILSINEHSNGLRCTDTSELSRFKNMIDECITIAIHSSNGTIALMHRIAMRLNGELLATEPIVNLSVSTSTANLWCAAASSNSRDIFRQSALSGVS